MDISQVSIYLMSSHAHALANLVSQILERDFVVSEKGAEEIMIELGNCILKILPSTCSNEKNLPIDLKLDSKEQFSQIKDKVEFYNFCEKIDKPIIYQRINDREAMLLDQDGRAWNFYL